MAILLKPKVKQFGNAKSFQKITIKVSSRINFFNIDRELGIKYYLRAFLYDVDKEEDHIIPIIKSLYFNIHDNGVEEIQDSIDGKDDLLFYKRIGIVEPNINGHDIDFEFNLVDESSSFYRLKKEALKALNDDEDNPQKGKLDTLEIKAIIVATNEVNGTLISESNILKVEVLGRADG